MTFNFAPWAIDGARSTAGLARLAAYASGGGRSGVIQPGDLKVNALSVPGQGLRIASGGAVVLNGYLTNPDEAYVVSNPSQHTVPSSVMPSAQPGTSYYLVCVVVGDPEFNQTGHPFMPSGPLSPEDAADFEYVRVVVIPCTAGASRFEDLGANYPGYALARLEVPANTTTITNAMITNLRSLSKPRTESRLILAQPIGPGGEQGYGSPDWTTLNGWLPVVDIPSWATEMQVVGHVSGIVHLDPEVVGFVRVRVSNIGGAETYYEMTDTNGSGERTSLTAVWNNDISAIAGQAHGVTIELRRTSGSGYLIAYPDMVATLDIRFAEKTI